MIVGIGNDIIEIQRFEKLIEKESFLNRYFTEKEISAGKKRSAFYAANFSVKESVSKVFGTGIRGFGLKDIEVLRDESGKPFVNLYGRAAKLAHSLEIESIFVSISDTDKLVFTMAVGEK